MAGEVVKEGKGQYMAGEAVKEITRCVRGSSPPLPPACASMRARGRCLTVGWVGMVMACLWLE